MIFGRAASTRLVEGQQRENVGHGTISRGRQQHGRTWASQVLHKVIISLPSDWRGTLTHACCCPGLPSISLKRWNQCPRYCTLRHMVTKCGRDRDRSVTGGIPLSRTYIPGRTQSHPAVVDVDARPSRLYSQCRSNMTRLLPLLAIRRQAFHQCSHGFKRCRSLISP